MAITRAGAEALILVASMGLFIGYHVWLFCFRGKGTKVTSEFDDLFTAGKLARSVWAEACATDEKDAILGVQQARNAMAAATYLSTISVALASAGITIIFDKAKTDRIAEIAVKDPMVANLEGPPLLPPIAVLAIALGSLYASFVCFGQSVRLYVHTGFYIRACTSRFNPGTLTVAEAKKVAINAGFAFTLGMRLFYAFIPLAMWSIGVTALLVASVCITALVARLDHFHPAHSDDAKPGDPEEGVPLAASHALQQQHRQQPGGLQLAASGAHSSSRLSALHSAQDGLGEDEASSPGPAPTAASCAPQPPAGPPRQAPLVALQPAQSRGGWGEQQQQQQQQVRSVAGSTHAPSRRQSAAQELSDEMVHSMV